MEAKKKKKNSPNKTNMRLVEMFQTRAKFAICWFVALDKHIYLLRHSRVFIGHLEIYFIILVSGSQDVVQISFDSLQHTTLNL